MLTIKMKTSNAWGNKSPWVKISRNNRLLNQIKVNVDIEIDLGYKMFCMYKEIKD